MIKLTLYSPSYLDPHMQFIYINPDNIISIAPMVNGEGSYVLIKEIDLSYDIKELPEEIVAMINKEQ